MQMTDHQLAQLWSYRVTDTSWTQPQLITWLMREHNHRRNTAERTSDSILDLLFKADVLEEQFKLLYPTCLTPTATQRLT